MRKKYLVPPTCNLRMGWSGLKILHKKPRRIPRADPEGRPVEFIIFDPGFDVKQRAEKVCP